MFARRRAVTLLEVLIVVVILGVLIAILLPAVQVAREAGRRAQCQNHLRQIGLAIQQYATRQGTFPPGNVTRSAGVCYGGAAGTKGYPSEDGANWCLSILPYLDQRTLFDAYDFEDFNEAPQNRAVRETNLPVFVCPSDLTTDNLVVPASGPACAFALNLPYRPASYRAVAGRSNGLRFLDSSELGDFPRADRGAIHTIGVRGFKCESPAHVRDGLSHTLLVGESTTRTSPAFRTFWAYSYAHYSLSSVTPQRRTLLGDYDQCKAATGKGASLPCRRGWGSLHGDVLYFTLCDGAVKPQTTSVDLNLLAAMATIDGRE